MKRDGNRAVFSWILVVGVLILIIGLVAPLTPGFFSLIHHQTDPSSRLAILLGFLGERRIRLLGLAVIIWGLVRTWVLRHRLKVIQTAKDEAGLLGEAQTAKALNELGEDYRVMHRFFLHHKGRAHEFDHVVIGPQGIFHVESKNWAGEIRISDKGTARSVPGNFHNPMTQIHNHHQLLESLLRDNGVTADVVGVLCFTNHRAQISDARQTRDVCVTSLHNVRHVIENHRSKRTLSGSDVKRTAHLIAVNSRPHSEDD